MTTTTDTLAESIARAEAALLRALREPAIREQARRGSASIARTRARYARWMDGRRGNRQEELDL